MRERERERARARARARERETETLNPEAGTLVDGEWEDAIFADECMWYARPQRERESSLLTTYWSESTLSL